MADENEIVAWIEKMVSQLIPKSFTSEPPQQIQVNRFSGGQGRGTTLSGKAVDFVTHPAQNIIAGNTVVGVPIGPNLYYVVGRK